MPVDPLIVLRALYVIAYGAAAAVDLRSRRIPNVVTYPLLVIALVARPVGVGLVPLANLITAIVVALVFVALVARGWMGMGDAKLAAVIALASGPALAAIALWLAFLTGAAVGVGLIAAKRLERRQPLPFGPFLALAGVLSVVIPTTLLDWSPFQAMFS